MASDSPTLDSPQLRSDISHHTDAGLKAFANSILRPLASLRLTVVLFALSILIVLFGTLAQTTMDIWDVIEGYFRVDFTKFFTTAFPFIHPTELFVRVKLQIFFPESFFPSKPDIPGWFPFPKGWMIGLVMAFNLIAAHAIRFKVQAKGQRLWLGWALIAFGCFVTWAMIASGSGHVGNQKDYLLSWSAIWRILQVSLCALTGAMIFGVFSLKREQKLHRSLLLLGIVICTPVLGWMLWQGSAVPVDASGMRILWQLIKGVVAGLVLLIGCVLVFKKRGGVVLLHAGVGLMMFYEVLVGVGATEAVMHIVEGTSTNFARDIRTVELAVIDTSPEDEDLVTVIPKNILLAHRPKGKEPGTFIEHPDLPFDLRLDEYYDNSRLDFASTEGDKVTEGIGKMVGIVPREPTTGASSDQESDEPAAIVSIYEKGHHDKLLSRQLLQVKFDYNELYAFVDQQPSIEVDGKKYLIQLRFERVYKPYEVKLDDVRAEFYEGTSQARDYSSDIVLTDADKKEQVKTTIWMNNPLRYGGETLYQQSYGVLADNEEYTALQVVSNTGWMTPYVACMIVAIGMLAQFLIALSRFLNRRTAAAAAVAVSESPDEESALPSSLAPGQAPAARGKFATWFPLVATLMITLWLGSKLIVVNPPTESALANRSKVSRLVWLVAKLIGKSDSADAHNLYQFGQIPVRDEGRLKPIDSVARNTLRFLSGRTEFLDANEKKQPAIKFLLDTMVPAGTYSPKDGEGIDFPLSASATHRVFRLTNLEAQKFLGLDHRSEYVEQHFKYLYSFDELLPAWPKLQDRMREMQNEMTASGASKRDLKLRELHGKLNHYYSLCVSFDPRFLSNVFSSELRRLQDAGDRAGLAKFMEARGDLDKMSAFLGDIYEKEHAVLLIPPPRDNTDTWLKVFLRSMLEPNQTQKEKWVAYPPMEIQISMGEATPSPERTTSQQLTQLFGEILKTYGDPEGDPAVFNNQVETYLGMIAANKPATLEIAKIRYEAYFNKTEIYYYAAAASIIAFILGAVSWIGWTEPLRKSAFWILLVLLIVHTYGLTSRIYISGRPPVTNLYSSAIFIGWGAIAFGLLMEWLYPIGISVTISSAMSFITLLIAHFLSIGGDTIGVLQAVLDTQFWLATHVVCITLGYTTTFVAGFLGLAYLIRGMFTPTLTAPMSKELIRMIYGVLCFSIFFSFVGTVLGGLWADDSWGRFWGWDPKENGALIIVLWNALVLHARWGGLVKDRGLANLAMGGNIATAWSWFGVNELGVGLHSYGFTDGVLLALASICVLQLALIVLTAVVPLQSWWSFKQQRRDELNLS